MTDISTITTTIRPKNADAPRRAQRPERIDLGDDEGLRNDLVAKQQGVSERTLNRGDAKGAPFIMIGGVKYRPIRAYRQFLASQIQVHGRPPQRRHR